MSTRVCVCLSVCLSVREHISGTMRDVYQFFCACCLWPYLGPPPAGLRNPKGRGNFRGFPGYSKALAIFAAAVAAAFAAKGII